MRTTAGDRIFAIMEPLQGRAFISDGMLDWRKARILKIARIALRYERRAVRALEKFIREESRSC